MYYTTDGTTPTTSSAEYAGPINVHSDQIIHAIALAPGRTQSGIASATYVITQITETVIHSFSINDANLPSAGLMQAGDGDFYGTAAGGLDGAGTVYRITPAGAESVLYSFTYGDPTYSKDGAYPEGPLIQANDGNFYGTTFAGGAEELGTVFKLTGVIPNLSGSDGGRIGDKPQRSDR